MFAFLLVHVCLLFQVCFSDLLLVCLVEVDFEQIVSLKQGENMHLEFRGRLVLRGSRIVFGDLIDS